MRKRACFAAPSTEMTGECGGRACPGEFNRGVRSCGPFFHDHHLVDDDNVHHSSLFDPLSAQQPAFKMPPKMSSSKKSSPSRALHTYLIAYNVVSLACWSVILFKTLSLLFTRQPFPNTVSGLINHLRSGYDYHHLGSWVIWTQTGALLEVVHAALGWVRSSPITVAMQVASRIWLVWGVLARQPETHSHPLFVTMVLAWSVTECIRYSFYACNLLGLEPALLNWLRYNTFYILYPLGAGSEAFLMFSTLPKFGDWANWKLSDHWTLALFVIWWPGELRDVWRLVNC